MMRIFGKRGASRQTAGRPVRPNSTRRLQFEQVESRVMLSAWEGVAPIEPVWEGEAPAEPLGQGPEVSSYGSLFLEDHVVALGSPGINAAGGKLERLTISTGGAIQIRPPLADGFVDIVDSSGLNGFGSHARNSAYEGNGTIVTMPARPGGPALVGPYHPPAGDPNGPPRNTIMIAMSGPVLEDGSGKDGGFISIAASDDPEAPMAGPALAAGEPSESRAEHADFQLDGAKGRAQVFEMAGLADRGAGAGASSPRDALATVGPAQVDCERVNPSAAGRGGVATAPAAYQAVEPSRMGPAEAQVGALAAGGVASAADGKTPLAGVSQMASSPKAREGGGAAHKTPSDAPVVSVQSDSKAESLVPAAPRDVASRRSWAATAYSSLAVLGTFLTYRHLSALRADRVDKNAGSR